ncbi:MAG: Nramp family divalent metal transporter [Candidatus Aminicenantales bacterium]
MKRKRGFLAGLATRHKPRSTAFEIFKYIGPGLLVTIGFIDPGNWGVNVVAGAQFGYRLLWVITLSTVMLVLLQHNAAHLGITTGLCLSEAATRFTPKRISVAVLGSAMLAAVSTVLAEILGGAIALDMLFGIPPKIGALLVAALVLVMLFTNSYRKIERWIIGFVSLIGISFIIELLFVRVDWPAALTAWVKPALPSGSLYIVLGVLGAVVMPHNLFLHSEIIQSRTWNLKDEKTIKKQLAFEFKDTLFSMGVGWIINSAMIILAAATFYARGITVTELPQAHDMMHPILGPAAALIFAIALLLAGIASSLTAGMAGATIMAGIFGEPYNLNDSHSRMGVALTFGLAYVIILFIADPLKGLISSQIVLSVQLPFTVFLLVFLTSSKKVMGKYANALFTKALLFICAAVVTYLNIRLLLTLKL